MHNTIKINTIKTYISSFLIIMILFVSATLYKSSTLGLYTNMVELLLIFSWIFLLINIKTTFLFLKTNFFVWISIVFVFFELYGFFKPVYGNFNWDYLLMLYASVVTICALFTCIPDSDKTKYFSRICAFTSMAICLYIFIFEYDNILNGGMRIGESGSGNVNTIGTYLSILSIPLLYFIIIKKRYSKLPVFLIQLVFMLLTGSKRSLLFILLGFVIFYIYKNGFKFYKYFKMILIISLVSLLIMKVDFFYNIIGYRIVDFLGEIGFSIADAGVSYSTELRIKMYSVAPTLFANNPIFGGGWGYFEKFSGLHVYSHSNIIEISISFGIVGFILYYCIFLSILKKSISQVRKKEGIIAFCYVVLIFVNDISVITFCQVPISYFALFIAYIFARNSLE